VQNGFDALFTTAAELIDHLSAASRDGSMRDALAVYLRPHVLIVDEVGYLTYGDDAANVLYHVVNDRHIKRRSMIFTTNKSPKHWGQALHDDDLADAIVDRILERGRLLRLDGPSVRKTLVRRRTRRRSRRLKRPQSFRKTGRRISGTYTPSCPRRSTLRP
jgi:DNA replication protein DnaC